MHRPRLLGWNDTNCYHVISRTTGRDFLFGPAEREMFGRMVARCAVFCGVEILTWCCLSNHFHLLIRISDSATEALRQRLRSDPAAFAAHLKHIYTTKQAAGIVTEIDQLRTENHAAEADAVVERLLARIGDVSIFTKELKQRFSIWYNHHHDRSGTLWSGRFRSVLVENSPHSLRTVAAYIDLNPVRAGIVDDPSLYRWCGYGQAMGGNRKARAGIRCMLQAQDRGDDPNAAGPAWKRLAEDYRVLLFGKATRIEDGDGTVLRRGVAAGNVAQVISDKGKLPPARLFRLRVRHLTRGAALGSKAFLDKLVEMKPNQFARPRATGARPIRQLDVDDFHSLRDLR